MTQSSHPSFLLEIKPSEWSFVPNFLWDELKDAWHPILSKHNSRRLALLRRLAVTVIVAALILACLSFVYSRVEDDDDVFSYTIRIMIIVSLLIFVLLFHIGSVICLNRATTRNIQEIASKLWPRFASNGVHIRFENRRLVLSPATTTTTTAVPVAVATNANATANTTTATTTTRAPVVADDKSPSPQFSPAPVYTTAANQGQFGKTTTTTTTSTMFDDNQPSVVDQMMADLNKPL